MRSPYVVLAALVISMLAAAPASAAIRYAQPNGFTFGDCTATTKCDFEFAVEGASTGDEIVVGGGTYNVSSLVQAPFNLDIHGDARGAAAPLINFTGGSAWFTGGTPASTIRDLRFQGQTASVVQTAGTIERVYSHADGGATACQAGNVLDSVCWSDDGRAVLATVGNVLIRNVTAYGGTYGIHAQTSSPGPVDVQVVNTIARGATNDLFAQGSSGLEAVITVGYSNFQDSGVPDAVGNQILVGANNQSDDPSLAGPLTGDFHQTATSPTRDRGQLTSGLDFEGEIRTAGGGTDIGADESTAPPVVATSAATEITGNAATLHGSVDTGGENTEYRFELAATPLLGVTGSVGSLPGASGSQAVSARIGGLAPDTTYYFRAVATNSKGTSTGPTLTFVTVNDDSDPPILGSLRLSRARFAVGRAFTPLSAVARGTTLSFRSSEAGSAAIAVQRAQPGRRRRGRCVKPRRARPDAPRCTRWTAVITLTRSAGVGTTRVPFSGRVGTRRLSRVLRPGRYRFRVRVRDKAGNRSDPAVISFRVVRG